MRVETGAILISAGVTSAVALLGVAVIAVAAREHPTRAAWGAPAVVVAALAAGVAAASRSMLLEENARNLVFVLLTGAPIALLCGLFLARRVRRIEARLQREQAERERDARLESERREMIRWLSHDLRTPLAGIRLLAENVEAGAIAASTATPKITREVDRLDAMVDDLAELSRLHGATTDEVVDLSVIDVVSDATAAVAPLADAKSVALAQGRLDDVSVPLDARAVSRAVTNVLRNGIAHTPPGGVLRISVTRPLHGARIAVADECGGIPEAHLPHVFEPGWRGAQGRAGSDATHPAGMGLGLAIVREVVRVHGGSADVSNLPNGSGCEFTIELPTRASTA